MWPVRKTIHKKLLRRVGYCFQEVTAAVRERSLERGAGEVVTAPEGRQTKTIDFVNPG